MFFLQSWSGGFAFDNFVVGIELWYFCYVNAQVALGAVTIAGLDQDQWPSLS